MKDKGFTTRLVHADRVINKPQNGAVHQATNNSVLFAFDNAQDLVDVFQGKAAGHVYSRSSSASSVSLQNILNELEGGVGAITFSTGMAAISATFLSLLRAGDHIIMSQFLFGNTSSLASTLQGFGIEISFVDATDVQNVIAAITPNTKLVYAETIANPATQVSDLSAIDELRLFNKALSVSEIQDML